MTSQLSPLTAHLSPSITRMTEWKSFLAIGITWTACQDSRGVDCKLFKAWNTLQKEKKEWTLTTWCSNTAISQIWWKTPDKKHAYEVQEQAKPVNDGSQTRGCLWRGGWLGKVMGTFGELDICYAWSGWCLWFIFAKIHQARHLRFVKCVYISSQVYVLSIPIYVHFHIYQVQSSFVECVPHF